ncbi:MAG TPA: protein kinase [Pyrinomonadaceae bacterium]|nr:protein kinase [Pyrinomonadaceae bacterium]
MLAGEQFGRYEISGKIGEGGMGEVYSARDLELDRNVAIKLLPNEFTADEERRLRFRQEAKVVSALNHPNVITIYEIGENDFGHFLATEFVEGKTLREIIKRESLTLTRILRIMEQAANALVAAHAEHIVHRDIKPENIMVRRDGIVKVLDFGLAKPVVGFKNGTDSTDNKTVPGTVMGSARYMSPEQARGLEVDERTDIWSLGVVLYELLIGSAPFDGETTADTLAAVIYHEPEAISNLLPNAPVELSRIVRKALQKDRDERYQSIKDLALDLKDLLHELEHSNSGNRTGHVTSNPNFSENPTIIHRTLSGNHRTDPVFASASSKNSVVRAKRRRFPLAIAAVLGLLVVVFGGYAIYSFAIADTPMAAHAFARPQISRINTDGRVLLPAISPDGKYVAYVAGEVGSRSLVVRQIATDSVVTVVQPTAQNLQSVTFSPTGDHIYYCLTSIDFSINTLYQVPTLGGTPKKLIEDVDSPVTFSPDGKQFAFVRHRSEPNEDAIFIANTDTLAMQELIASGNTDYDFFAFRLAWSPDGRTLVTGAGNRESGFLSKTDLVEITLADKKIRTINGPREFFHINNVVWFADGSGVLFSGKETQNAPNQIWRASYPDGRIDPVTNDFNDYLDVSVSDDGKSIATLKADTVSSVWKYAPAAKKGTQFAGESRNLDGMHGLLHRRDGSLVFTKTEGKETDIWVTDGEGKSAKVIHTEPGYSVMPVAPADGAYLVFNVQKDKTSKIWRSNPDGSNPVQLSEEDAAVVDFNPQLTPDGSTIIFQRKSDDERFSLMRMPIEGGKAEKFYDAPGLSVFMPRIAPDGKRIAYTAYDVKTFQKKLYIATLEGGAFGNVEQEIEYNLINQYAWSPDGKALTVLTNRTGVQNIWRQPIDGSTPTQITDFKSGRIMNFTWTADGKELFLVRGNTNNDLILIKDADRNPPGQTVAKSRSNDYGRANFNLYNFLFSSVR